MPVAGLLARRVRTRRLVVSAILAVLLGLLSLANAPSARAAGPCGPPVTSVIACENTQPGDPPSDWQVSGAGDSTIQGFATSMSVNAGQTESFKISTPASSYHIDILRIGWYQGNGARKVVPNMLPTASLPQTQPACKNDTGPTGLIDCGNWAVSASWAVPSTAVSGLYIAHLVRNDTGGSSLIPFVVRNDASHSDILYQTADETWQAYNTYGGNSLYQCTVNCPPGSPEAYKGASKVSYNRPWHTALDDSGRSWFMYAEYPMIRFLEENGYDVSYTSGIDMSQPGAASIIEQHKVFMYDRPRRVLDRPAARERHSRPRCGGEPGLLQRERGLLEDQAGAKHRRVEHREPDAGDLQGDALRHSRRSAGPAHLDGYLDGSAVQPAGRRRQPAELADRAAVRRQLRHHRHHRAIPVQQAAVLAQHPGGQPGLRPVHHAGSGSRRPRL